MADITSSPAVTIENTDWRLSFSPSPSLVTADLSLNPMIWLFVLSGVFGAVWLCILEPRKRLEANVKRMLTAADNREPLSLDYPELAPISQVLCQLTLNHRLRQKRAVSEPVAQADEAEEVSAELPSERIHQTPWTVKTGSWVTLPPISAAEEINAINELARGIASLSL